MLYTEPRARTPVVAETEPNGHAPKRLKMGIIGCGYWGPKLLRNFESLPNTEVAMVADLNPKALAEVRRHFRDLETTSDHRELLASEDRKSVV